MLTYRYSCRYDSGTQEVRSRYKPLSMASLTDDLQVPLTVESRYEPLSTASLTDDLQVLTVESRYTPLLTIAARLERLLMLKRLLPLLELRIAQDSIG